MAVVALATALGLQLLGMPLAITLGLIAGLLGFVPGIGPILATVPAALVALLQSPLQVLYVVVLYVAVQLVEGYLLTPLVQRYTVALPPVLTVVGIVLLGVLLGGLGLVLAAPLTIVVFILVKMLYIEDVLGDVMEAPGEQYNSSAATPLSFRCIPSTADPKLVALIGVLEISQKEQCKITPAENYQRRVRRTC